MTTMPSIWDILDYEEKGYGFKGRKQGEDDFRAYRTGGQGDMLSYLSNLLEKSEWKTDEMKEDYKPEGSGWWHSSDRTIYDETMFKLSKMLGTPMEEYSERDYGSGWTGNIFLEKPVDRWEEFIGSEDLSTFFDADLTDMEKTIFQTIQEGLRAVPSSESFGLGRKIGDIETTGKREFKSAREGYIPGEILSRYGALQGRPGAQQKGEELEQAYTSDIYGVQRGMGRDVKSTYEDFGDEWFGGIESWLSNLG